MRTYAMLTFCALALSAVVVGSGCDPSEAAVPDEIRQANFCTTAADCADAGPHCPYGCNVLVNTSKVDEIGSLLDSIDESCAYDCAVLINIECENQICVGQYQ